MKTIRTLALLTFVAAATALASGCIIVSDDDSTLTIVNDSDFVLVDIAVAPAGLEYGGNLIPAALLPGEEVTISLDCDFYDVRIEDEDGFVCELLDVDICLEDAVFFIDNADLNGCGTFALRDQGTDKQTKPAETKQQ